MRKPLEHLEHGGVHLRRWRLEDADAVLRVVLESREQFEDWFPWATQEYRREKATEFMASTRADWESGRSFEYAVLDQDSQVIGAVSLMGRIGPGGFEIGYWLHSAQVGRGIMRRAVRAAIDEAFRIGADHVEIHHDENNLRSRAIPEALGFALVHRYRSPDQQIGPQRTGYNSVWRLSAPG